MLYIRTDMNQTVATGHVMRCLAIADAAKDIGEDTTFILADAQAVRLLERRGYQYIVLNTRWDDMDSELQILEEAINKYHITSILIDSYQVTERYLLQLKKRVKTILLDDLHVFDYPANKIICYANYYKQLEYDEKKYDALYLGTEYVPLRKAFQGREKKTITDKIKRVLICSGGSDPYGTVVALIEKLKEKYEFIDAVCGMYSNFYDELQERYGAYDRIQILRDVKDIENYMEKADVAIAAGGTTLYELCAVGTPAISYVIADNQLRNVKQFYEDGIIAYAGDVRKEDVVSSALKYLELYEPKEARREKSKRMQELVDGRGAFRIAEHLLERG